MLTARDQDLLETLALRVRVLSIEQVARHWWPDAADPVRLARRRLRTLESGDYVRKHTFLAHPILEMPAPVFTWQPGQPPPNPDAISYGLTSRWTAPSRRVSVIAATQRTKGIIGGGIAQLSPLGHETHDLHVSEIFVRLRERQPELAERWRGEESFARARSGEKRPDAMLVDGAGQPELVIEFAGKYSADHVWSFHEDCEARELPYELW